MNDIGNYSNWVNACCQGHLEDDPDGFGIPNLLRYALHLDANAPDLRLLLRISAESTDGDASPILEFQLLMGISDWSR